MKEKRQLDLLNDLPRGEQLKLLRAVRFETYRNGNEDGVKADKQKALLRLIDDHDGDGQGCFASQDTLAKEIGCSVSTVGRAVEALVSQGLITKERDDRTGANRHRIIWSELKLRCDKHAQRTAMVTDANRHGDGSRTVMVMDAVGHDDVSQSVTVTDALCHDDGQNETETQQLNATTTATDENEWLLLRRRLRDLGMKAAAQATNAARQRGLSLEYIDELIREATKRKRPQDEPYGVSHLCNWLTGKTFPPIDEADAMRIRDERRHHDREAAEAIRQRIASEPKLKDATDEVKAGWVGRLLARDGLDTEATDDERAAATKLDEFDQKQQGKRLGVAS
ncbi:helix-turn-helix domain-containing protein [Rhodopirellula sallentina]|uniref:Uncharacterized protein n=1 Tax=Rhodopirellula sallentina SM41 TaxID=1263870 RepID=M5U9M1_9BACT|nr:helix-turn-helix domain-containing protein [Rhodopirellula sallentina]EMI58132.1 hypothetical protein RSSM_00412 [Rhodopirellula sallentina SM41]